MFVCVAIQAMSSAPSPERSCCSQKRLLTRSCRLMLSAFINAVSCSCEPRERMPAGGRAEGGEVRWTLPRGEVRGDGCVVCFSAERGDTLTACRRCGSAGLISTTG